MDLDSLKGKSFVAWLRCSTTINEESIDQQRKVIAAFAKKYGLICVREIVLDGVSGTETRPHLDKLLAEHKANGGFDILIAHDFSRLTRNGMGDGSEIRSKFAEQDILILAATEPLPDGEYSELIGALIDFKNSAFLTRLSFDIVRGIRDAILKGDVEHHGSVGFGIDRLYGRIDGTPFMRLVYTDFGGRELYDEIHGTLIRRFDNLVDRNSAYRKMKGEKVWLVVSSGTRADTVRWMFAQRYKHNWTYNRIARNLNGRNIRPTKAAKWHSGAVRDVLMNPMYLGWSYNFVTTCAKRNAVTSTGVVSIGKPLRKAKLRQKKFKEFSMFRVEHPRLKDFIEDVEIQEKATSVIMNYLRTCHLRRPWKKVENKTMHPMSSYFLRDVLREATTNSRFTSRTGKSRSYVVVKASEMFEADSFLRRSVPAKPIEAAAIDVMHHIFVDKGRFKARVQTFVAKHLAAQPERMNREELQAERKEIEKKLDFIFESSSRSQLERLRETIKKLNDRTEEIEKDLLVQPLTDLVSDAPKLAETICASLPDINGDVSGEVLEKLRALTNVMCKSFTINLETLEAELVVGLPETYLQAVQQYGVEVSVPNTKVNSVIRHPHRVNWLELGNFKISPINPRCGLYKQNIVDAFTWTERGPTEGDLPNAA